MIGPTRVIQRAGSGRRQKLDLAAAGSSNKRCGRLQGDLLQPVGGFGDPSVSRRFPAIAIAIARAIPPRKSPRGGSRGKKKLRYSAACT